MSRWGKNRSQSFALPLDALVKEKENTNRPVAARSAGTVGKWGITSFTSIRAHSIYGYDSYTTTQESPQHQNSVSQSPNDGQPNQLAQSAGHLTDVTPKPKKFFKSRNSVPETDLATLNTAINQNNYPNANAPNDTKQSAKSAAAKKNKIKKELRKKEEKQKVKVEKPKVEKPKAEKPVKVTKKKTKTEEKSAAVNKVKPTRVLSRARKAVNYSEDKSRSASPVNVIQTAPAQSTNLITSEQPPVADEIQTNPLALSGASPAKSAIIEHPPIVLRISKGTSRLISTDSEGINNSPPYLSPIQQSQVITTNYQSAAASLVAVLSDDPPIEQQQHQPDQETNNSDAILDIASKSKLKAKKLSDELREKAEPIKIRIKTKLSKHKFELENFETDFDKTPTRPNDYPQTVNDFVEQQQTASQSYGNAYDATTDYPQYESQKPSDADQLCVKQDTVLDASVGVASVSTEVKEPPKRATRNKGQAKENTAKVVEVPPETKETTVQKPKRNRRNQKRTAEDNSQNLTEQSPKKEIEEAIATEAAKTPEPTTKPPVEKEPLMVSPKKRRILERNIPVSPPPVVQTRTRRGKAAVVTEQVPITAPTPAPVADRRTRSKRTEEKMQEKDIEPEVPLVTRSYSRKRKIKSPENNVIAAPMEVAQTSAEDTTLLLTESEQLETRETVNINIPLIDPDLNNTYEQKAFKTRAKRQMLQNLSVENTEHDSNNHTQLPTTTLSSDTPSTENNEEKPSVKLVISKKKGSIFKSRAVNLDTGENVKQKRHVYKHKWDDDLNEEEKSGATEMKNSPASHDPYADDFAQSGSGKGITSSVPASGTISKLTSDDDLRVRNVKKAHQMQEIGEFQEMDDDVEYILESLKNHNPIATRGLAAVQLASKCMTPAFRMHVRAHGTATKFFSALHDATQNRCLGLCTATIMFVLIQDNLNMDLDKDSLELMLNLLDSDLSQKPNSKDSGLTDEQLQRIESKVFEICREIKSQGKASYLKLDNISIGTLAMETLLTLTSKRAGEWFKDELRSLGGLEHIIDTICECCKQITDYVVSWTDVLLEKLRKIERCLRVLENVSERNEDNQKYILYYKDGHMVETLVKFYKLCDTEISLYPTTEQTPPENPGVVLREALVPTLKVLINLTHTFHNKPLGCSIFGENPIIFATSFHLLFQAPHYVPEKCIFELSLLVLLLLNNLTVYSIPNRASIMEAIAPSDFGNKFVKIPAIKALIEYFYKYEELARFVEQNTDDILNDPKKCDKTKYKSQEEIEETVSTLIQKAGNHMEHTMLASYVCLLIGHLVIENKDHESAIRKYLRNGTFEEMVQILEKYYNFMNLTASSEATQVAHIKETKRIIQYLKDSDLHERKPENPSNIKQWQLDKRQDGQRAPQQYSQQSYKTYSSSASTPLSTSTSSSNPATATSSSEASINNNSAFNKLFHSYR